MDKKRALVAIVNFKGKILVGKKRSDSPKVLSGEWHLPGETTEDKETDEEALIRGIKEEAGLEITVGRYVASHISPTYQRDVKWYECFANEDNLSIGGDLEDAKFVQKKEVLGIFSKKVYSILPVEVIRYFS